MTCERQSADEERLAAMLQGHIVTQLIVSAVRFNIPDLLADGAITDTQLSVDTGISLPEMRRFLRALQGLGLVEPIGPSRYRCTESATHIRRDGSLYDYALMAGGEYYEAWSELDFALRTGQSAFERRRGRDLWAQLASNDQSSASFTRTMRSNTERVLDEVIELCEFPATGLIADLGAGDGTLLAGLLTRFTELRAIAFEQPSVIDYARRTLAERGLANRCNFVSGDFLTEVPQGADLYVLKSVIHNWNDVMALQILKNCRSAMAARKRLVVIERPVNAGDLLRTAMADMTMLVLFGSRDRTAEEYGQLLEGAGFSVLRVAESRSGFCVLDAAPSAV